MEILFWGTRGSIPYAVTSKIVKKKIKTAIQIAQGRTFNSSGELDLFIEEKLPFSIRGGFGCNTSCVEIKGGNQIILCDAGTGLRDFGNFLLASSDKKKAPKIINIFLSHLHWDHIQGFPLFTPAYIPGYVINIYGFHDGLEDVFIKQQAPPCFPLPLQDMQSEINFITLDIKEEYTIDGYRIKGIKQNHPGDSYGYSFEKENKKMVYSTDSEHKKDADQEDYKFIELFKNADLLILDAQYSLLESLDSKENWGHSSNIMVTELAARSNAKRLCMFHHEHTYDDDDLEKFLKNTRNYLKNYDKSSQLKIEMAYDGMQIKL